MYETERFYRKPDHWTKFLSAFFRLIHNIYETEYFVFKIGTIIFRIISLYDRLQFKKSKINKILPIGLDMIDLEIIELEMIVLDMIAS